MKAHKRGSIRASFHHCRSPDSLYLPLPQQRGTVDSVNAKMLASFNSTTSWQQWATDTPSGVKAPSDSETSTDPSVFCQIGSWISDTQWNDRQLSYSANLVVDTDREDRVESQAQNVSATHRSWQPFVPDCRRETRYYMHMSEVLSSQMNR
jgi:hypothetical protein